MTYKKSAKIPKRGQKQISNFDLQLRLRSTAELLLERDLDPLPIVLSTIDPHYDQDLRPDIKHNPNTPKNASLGTFRLIYCKKNGKKKEYRTHALHAKNGYDALNRFSDIGDHIFSLERGDITVIGVECELVPSKLIEGLQEEYRDPRMAFDESSLGQVALLNLIETLEEFEEQKEQLTLDQFMKDFKE